MTRKAKTEPAPVEVLQALLTELRSLVTLTKEKIREAKPRKVKQVPRKFTEALRKRYPKLQSLRLIPWMKMK
jgi:hypothetical protein